MPLIRILPVDLRNKIAAGEVVERPASVVKELVENSLDAASTEITVEVLNGGKRLIRVEDNGAGMNREDALLALERHATSKISDFDDLFSIATFGFRGEALPSIASVAKMRLKTGLQGSSTGVELEIEGGAVNEARDAAFTGTSCEVRDLFFNTPARKKFLKTTATELFHIIDALTKEALSNPGTGFRLVVDNQETMRLPRASGSRERVMQLFGAEFLDGLIDATAEAGGMRVSALVSKPDNFRSTKSHQYLFINRRPVRDPSVSHAVYRAYEGILPADRHPIFFLFLEMPAGKVDFNVHPTKREVRLEDKESVYRFVLGSLRDKIVGERRETARDFLEPMAFGETRSPSAYPETGQSAGFSVSAEPQEFGYRPALASLYLGDTFVAFTGKGGLMIIDHHAAHERILYEKLLAGMRSLSRQLLFPKQVRLSGKEYRAVLGAREMLADLGIEVEDFGRDTVLVRSLPEEISEADIAGILSDLAAAIAEGDALKKPLANELAARIACHQSVRGRRMLSSEELSRLIEDLEKTAHPDQCPHGRPTRIFYSLNDLNKLFQRK